MNVEKQRGLLSTASDIITYFLPEETEPWDVIQAIIIGTAAL